ncbi:MAG: hypothetical protein ACQEQU_00850 [Spirochaetota bacterium]
MRSVVRLGSIALLVAVVLLGGCRHTSPFTQDFFYRSLGEKGDAVVTVNLEAAQPLFDELDADTLDPQFDPILERTGRISVALDPGSQQDDLHAKGGLEGNFGTTAVRSVLGLSSQWSKVSSAKPTFYTDSEGSIQVLSPQSGLVLFATDGIERTYAKSYAEREILIPHTIAQRMARGMFAFYMEDPEDLSLFTDILPDKLVDSIQSLWLVFEHETSHYAASGEIRTYNRAAGRVLSTSLKKDYLDRVRELEEPPEDWMDDIQWDDRYIDIDRMFVENTQVVDLFSAVLQQL